MYLHDFQSEKLSILFYGLNLTLMIENNILEFFFSNNNNDKYTKFFFLDFLINKCYFSEKHNSVIS